MNDYVEPPFAAGFLINKWFILLNALIFTTAALLLSGWWRLGLFIALIVGLELSGVMGRRFQFMWAQTRWFRIYVGLVAITLVGFGVATWLTHDDEVIRMLMVLGLLIPIFFLLPLARFTKTLLFPP
jgi:hypothetical protein